MRIFLGVHKYAPLLGIIGDMGWPDFQTYKQSGRMRLWNRLIAMNDSRLTKQIFLHDYNVSLRNTWSFDVLNICEQNNIRNIYILKNYNIIW